MIWPRRGASRVISTSLRVCGSGRDRAAPGVTQAEAPIVSPFVAPSPDEMTLLAETRGALAPGAEGSEAFDMRSAIDAILARLDAIAERPIDVTLTTQLNGREIAKAVYRDLREQKIKAYETL